MDRNCRRLKDLIVCQLRVGSAAEVTAGLIQAAAPDPGVPPAQCATSGEYGRPRPVKVLR